ncbi:DUF308 domain-containing protein [Gryllotalpicola ginsengisoli]|uniref:DUF308 domain-containing protein n=1 Tax=Gryllotalpicola ginsengisoli TaxID=444608 RepID=UPI0003B46F13|nr:DUF308 domain-containing protein [Gryllotalpicola ginsengisoli]
MAARYWLAQFARAVVALAAGAAITFDQGHSAALGLGVFSAFAILGGLVTCWSGFLVTDASFRALFAVQGLVGVAAGVVALVVRSGGLGALLYTVSVWALITGVLELLAGWRARRRLDEAAAVSRDWLLAGIATVVLAIVYLVIPPEHRLVVGLLGAYAVIIGVYLAIGAFSLKWAHPTAALDADEATESHA